MRLSMTLRSGTGCICALALSIGALWSSLALAEDAADAIAGRFAADEAEAQGGTDEDAKWLREEARRAVKRALAQENERAASTDVPPAGEPSPSDDRMAETGSEPKSKESATARKTAAESVKDVDAERHADDGKMLEAEGKELADKLRNVRRKREAGVAEPDRVPAANDEAKPGLVEKAVSGIATKVAGYISPLVEKRVSILMVMEVGKKGVRAWSKTADPMVCIHEFCYLSRGPDKPAERLTRSAAFGPTVALGKRGQACRSKPACIFRNIDLETVEARLQPVDLRFLRHDRREAKTIRADASCGIYDGDLSCRAPVAGKGWRAWIVPETVAEMAGAQGLKAAMDKGLD